MGVFDYVFWIAVMTAPQREALVAEALNSLLISVAYPQVRVVERKRFRGSVFHTVEKICPRFPRYLFANVDDRHIRGVVEVRGVSAIVSDEGGPISVPGEVVDEVMMGSDGDGVVQTLDYTKPRALGKPGDAITVEWPGNPYDGLVGALAAIEGKRVRAWLRILGGERSVRLPIERVRPRGLEGHGSG